MARLQERVLVLDFNSIKVRLNLHFGTTDISSVLFQFHKGTIKPSYLTFCISVLLNFNSIKVRLNLKKINNQIKYINFNSIKVRLNRFLLSWSCILVLHFNSIKVRLNLAAIYKGVLFNLFQFHKGTIKPMGKFKWCRNAKKIQFHKGTIKPGSALIYWRML